MLKQKTAFIIGISLPLLLTVIILLSVFIPPLFVKPQQNFLYVLGYNGYADSKIYYVKNNKIMFNSESYTQMYPQNEQAGAPKLFLYNITTDQSQSITLQQAQSLVLDKNIKSTEGFTIESGTSRSNIPFMLFSSSYYYGSQYITGNGLSKKLNINFGEKGYYEFDFIGWVK